MEISHIVMGSYFVTRAFTGAPLKFAEPWPVSRVEGLWGPRGPLLRFPAAVELATLGEGGGLQTSTAGPWFEPWRTRVSAERTPWLPLCPHSDATSLK